jgi:hypothetical protein
MAAGACTCLAGWALRATSLCQDTGSKCCSALLLSHAEQVVAAQQCQDRHCSNAQGLLPTPLPVAFAVCVLLWCHACCPLQQGAGIVGRKRDCNLAYNKDAGLLHCISVGWDDACLFETQKPYMNGSIT